MTRITFPPPTDRRAVAQARRILARLSYIPNVVQRVGYAAEEADGRAGTAAGQLLDTIYWGLQRKDEG